jgi:hypothetical protein
VERRKVNTLLYRSVYPFAHEAETP